MQKSLIAALAMLLAAGCRNALLDTPQPLVRSTLALLARPLTSDTVQVTLVLSTGPVRTLGSITAELSNTTDWTFTGCTTAQGEALLACKAHPGSVRVAAWLMQRAKAGDLLDSGQRPSKLPIELAKRLPDLPNPYTRLILGADVLLVNRDSHAILDVIPQIAY